MTRKIAAICLFISTIGLLHVSAQSDPNIELMKQLYTKIGDSVGVGSNSATGESFLVLANPGILLDPALNYDTPEGRYRLSKTIDKVLKADWIYKTGSDGTFDVYNYALNYHEAAVVTPTAAQKSQYMKACRIIFTDCDSKTPGNYTDAYDRYSDLSDKLAVAAEAAEDYQRINGTDDLPPDIARNLRKATQDLSLLGNKVTVESAMATINSYEHIDPNAWWGELQGRMLNNALTYSGNQYGNYNLYPAYPVWLDMNRSWSKLTVTQSDLEQTTHNSQSSVGGGLSGGWGFWSWSADYAHQENRSYFKLDASGVTVSMELMRVVLDRPWMDDAVFASHAWKWLKASPYDGQKISDGGDAVAGVTPQGIMPFLQTGLLLARRVSLSGQWSSDLATAFNSHTTGGASIGWGPISFGGRYDASDASTYHKAIAAGNTVSWDAPQIIGVFVEVLPMSPSPNKCYKFASDTTPLPPECRGGGRAPAFHGYALMSTVSRSKMLLDTANVILTRANKASQPK